MMTEPTQEQLDRLARVFWGGETGCPEDAVHQLTLNADTEGVTTTRDTMDQFRAAATRYAECSGIEDHEGGIYIRYCQAQCGAPRVAVAVIDCGEFRLAYQQ